MPARGPTESLRLLPRDLRHVGRHGLDLRRAQLALERRHRAAADLDLVRDDVLRRLERVEVRPDVAARPCVLERVAAGAAGAREDLLPVRCVATALDVRLRAAGAA